MEVCNEVVASLRRESPQTTAACIINQAIRQSDGVRLWAFGGLKRSLAGHSPQGAPDRRGGEALAQYYVKPSRHHMKMRFALQLGARASAEHSRARDIAAPL